ncbi:MAG TPA: amidase [Pseudonocardiaceae bacterium]|jgi:amidase|nr:amidase [Pseudonocardiaceae bacterium]
MDLTDVCFAGVGEQARLLATGQCSARELVAAYLARIEWLDPGLRAYRLVFAEQALAEAAAADERRAHGETAPLLGIPIAIKEDQAIAGVATTNGTDAVTTVAPADGGAVAALRAAGAVLLGQTRAPELCLWPYTETGHAGATRNPWSAAHSPGGSSGGSAAAVAAGLACAALGSDGGGSIRLPASVTGLFGLKPTRDRVSLAPRTAVWHGFSVVGPITRTVDDAALLTDVLQDPATDLPTPSGGFAGAGAPGRLRIAVSPRSWPVGVTVHPEVAAAVTDTARALAELGHRVVYTDPVLPDPLGLLAFAPRYLDSAAQGVTELEEPGRLDRRTRQVAAIGRRVPAAVLAASAKAGARITAVAGEFFRDVDVLLTPMTPRPPLRVGEWAGYSTLRTLLTAQRYVSFAAIWNLTGQPAAAVPAGFTTEGLPLSVQLVARHGDDATVLAVSRQLQDVRPWTDRRPHLG